MRFYLQQARILYWKLLSGQLPQVVALAENQVGLRVAGGADLAESAVAAGALKTVLVPEQVQGVQHEPAREERVRLGVLDKYTY